MEKEKILFPTFTPIEEGERRGLPDFPLDALPDVLRDIVKGIALEVQAPAGNIALQMFGVLSVCLQGKFEIEVYPGRIESGINIYGLTIAKTGERKTACLSPLKKPLEQCISEENERNKKEIKLSQARIRKQEQIIQKIEKSMGGMGGRDKSRNCAIDNYETPINESVDLVEQLAEANIELERLKKEAVKPCNPFIDDATPEGTILVLAENNGMAAVVTDEGGIFQNLAGLYSKSGSLPNIDLFLKGYDGSSYNQVRVGRPSVHLDQVYITMSLSVQPIVVKEAMDNPFFRQKGLLARFLFSWPESRVGDRFTRDVILMPDTVKDRYQELIQSLYGIQGGGIIKSDDDVAMAYKILVDNTEIQLRPGSELSDVVEWGNRYVSHVARIAAILHIAKAPLHWNSPLSIDTFTQAVKIGEYFKAHACAVYRYINGIDEDSEKDLLLYVWKKIKAIGDGSTVTEVQRKAQGRIENVEELRRFLLMLQGRGYIVIRSEKTAKKSHDVIYINPEALRN